MLIRPRGFQHLREISRGEAVSARAPKSTKAVLEVARREMCLVELPLPRAPDLMFEAQSVLVVLTSSNTQPPLFEPSDQYSFEGEIQWFPGC